MQPGCLQFTINIYIYILFLSLQCYFIFFIYHQNALPFILRDIICEAIIIKSGAADLTTIIWLLFWQMCYGVGIG